MVPINEIIQACETLLEPHQLRDYCPNGLQVAGKPSVTKLITGVTACQQLLDAAVSANADAILVHHGYFWKGEDPCVVGIMRERLKTLLTHDINLIAYHLPLDVHPELGNNIKLAQHLNIHNSQQFPVDDGTMLGNVGDLLEPCSGAEFAQFISQQLGREPLHIPGHDRPIKKIAWCTGAAQDFLPLAAARGADAYISGEVSERTTHMARELGIDYFAAGHHATEQFGVQALGEHLSREFNLEHEFINIDNPV